MHNKNERQGWLPATEGVALPICNAPQYPSLDATASRYRPCVSGCQILCSPIGSALNPLCAEVTLGPMHTQKTLFRHSLLPLRGKLLLVYQNGI